MPQNTYSDYLKFQKDKEMNSKKDSAYFPKKAEAVQIQLRLDIQ